MVGQGADVPPLVACVMRKKKTSVPVPALTPVLKAEYSPVPPVCPCGLFHERCSTSEKGERSPALTPDEGVNLG